MLKHKFLVVYDYGTGGVWGYVTAHNAEEITSRFPNLEVVDHKPSWIDAVQEAVIEGRGFDVDTASPPSWASGPRE